MRKKEYMISATGNSEEIIVTTLKEARKIAKRMSKEYGHAVINKWMFDGDCQEMVIDENFDISYENGKEN